MFFNDEDTLTYENFKAKIRIPEPELVRSLQSLSCGKYKVLLKNPKSKDISPSDVFTFNNQFTCPQYRIKIPTVSLAAQEQDSQAKDTAQKITEGRKFMIDAAIVRVMKSRQKMEHSQLIVDVTSQLTSRFIPDPLMIKKQIEVLIDREYLERVEGNSRMYQYVA
jgi:cullin 3